MQKVLEKLIVTIVSLWVALEFDKKEMHSRDKQTQMSVCQYHWANASTAIFDIEWKKKKKKSMYVFE